MRSRLAPGEVGHSIIQTVARETLGARKERKSLINWRDSNVKYRNRFSLFLSLVASRFPHFNRKNFPRVWRVYIQLESITVATLNILKVRNKGHLQIVKVVLLRRKDSCSYIFFFRENSFKDLGITLAFILRRYLRLVIDLFCTCTRWLC